MTKVPIPKLNPVIKHLSAWESFIDENTRGRRLVLMRAGLGRFTTTLDLSGSSDKAAATVVLKLNDYGPLLERPEYHALGALLVYLIDTDDLGREASSCFATLLVEYELVNDPDYLQRLATQYELPAPERKAPTTPSPAIEQPDFDPVAKPDGLETVINSKDNFLDIAILAGAIYSSQAVCRVEDNEGSARGTAFLIGPDLVMTNQHVIESQDQLNTIRLRFDCICNVDQTVREGRVFELQPDCFHHSPKDKLDYTLVRTTAEPLKEVVVPDKDRNAPLLELVRMGKHRGYLLPAGPTILSGQRVNIIQHPGRDPMKVVMTQNYVAATMTDNRVQYVADTMDGSSGSPVFNSRLWEVVALHHSGKPYPPEDLQTNAMRLLKGHFKVNEGIPMKAILADMRTRGIDKLLPSYK